MKTIICILAIATTLHAAEESRTWTSAEGKTLSGKLVGKTDDSAEIMLASLKRVKIPLAKLSSIDQEYVKSANVLPPPEMLCKTVSVKSNEAGSKADARGVEITVTNTAGKSHRVDLIWLVGGTSSVNPHLKNSQTLSADGPVNFAITLRNGLNYKGYAAALYDAEGKEIARFATMKPWERFIDECANMATSPQKP